MSGDYLNRLDPDQETRKLVEGIKPVTDPEVSAVLSELGVGAEIIEELRELVTAYDAMGDDLGRIGEALAPLGWIAFGSVPHDEYRTASMLAEQGKAEMAEAVLVKAWNDDGHLDMYLSRVGQLYYGSQEQNLIGTKRFDLLREALEAHRQELYGPAIALVLAQIDGIVFDMTGKKASSFYATGKKAGHLRDETTLAGHLRGLTVLADLFCKDNPRTQMTGEMRRHGVVHGRELTFNTLANSTKAFVCLLAVIEWAKPRADELARQRRDEYESTWAGSDELDEFGRRRDNRGFAAAKEALHKVANYQFGQFSRNSRYASEVDTLDPGDGLKLRNELRFETSDDGRKFFCWIATPSGWVFAIAGEDGEYAGFEYDGSKPPDAGPGGADDWRHSASDLSPPNW